MLNGKNRFRDTATIAAAAAAAVLATAGIAAASVSVPSITSPTATALHAQGGSATFAAPRTSPAIAGTEHFQLVTANPSSSTAPVIAYGVFTGAAVDHQGNSVDRFVFRNGSFKVRHSPGKGPQSFNPKTCLMTISQHGTYKIIGGTGRYAGISGHGKYHITLLLIAARSKGKCSQSKPPVAFQQIIMASGPVRL
jgi:hypothetical protein